MWRHVALVGTNILEKCIPSIIRVKRISKLGTVLAVTSNCQLLLAFLACQFVTLMKEVIHSSETSVPTRATWHHIPEGILHSHHCENLKSYIARIGSQDHRKINKVITLHFCVQAIQCQYLVWSRFQYRLQCTKLLLLIFNKYIHKVMAVYRWGLFYDLK
jgi:hypothetical protein